MIFLSRANLLFTGLDKVAYPRSQANRYKTGDPEHYLSGLKTAVSYWRENRNHGIKKAGGTDVPPA